MLKLSSALDAWSPSDGQPSAAADPVVLLGAVWPEIVGEKVAQHSHPVQVAGETLIVATRSSAWSEQLSFLCEPVLAAIRARLPSAGIQKLRFRVGFTPRKGIQTSGKRVSTNGWKSRARRAASGSAAEALARFRTAVEAARRAKAARGWKECPGCSAPIPPGGSFCVPCAHARADERERLVSRLLFEAPWLGYPGIAALVEEVAPEEYEAIRRRLLTRWWERLVRAARTGQMSRDRSERSIASSYVLLKSGLAPERVNAAVLRNVLGDDLHDLVYGTETNNTNVE
jgi:hypothetical protein